MFHLKIKVVTIMIVYPLMRNGFSSAQCTDNINCNVHDHHNYSSLLLVVSQPLNKWKRAKKICRQLVSRTLRHAKYWCLIKNSYSFMNHETLYLCKLLFGQIINITWLWPMDRWIWSDYFFLSWTNVILGLVRVHLFISAISYVIQDDLIKTIT